MRLVIILSISVLVSVVGYFLFRSSTEPVENHSQAADPYEHTHAINNNPNHVHIDDEINPPRLSKGKSVEPLVQAHMSGSKDNNRVLKHWNTFLSLISTDPGKGYTALSKFADNRYGQHPLIDEWKARTFRMCRDGKSSLPDAIRYIKIQIELLEYHSDENAEQLKKLQKSLKLLQSQSNVIKQAGEDPANFEVGFEFKEASGAHSAERK